MGKVIYKNLDKSDTLSNMIADLMLNFNLQDSHITLEKRNRTYYMKASSGKFVFSEKNYDPYVLVDKVIMGLNRQIKEYDRKKNIMFRKTKSGITTSQELQKIKKFVIKPMLLEEAIDHMKILEHKFYIYIDNNGKSTLLFEKDGEVYSQTIFPSSSLEDAVLKVLDEDIDYFAFLEEDCEVMTVVYKRKSGDVGIIDANMQ